MTTLITLTNVGSDAGPFNLYSNIGGYDYPFETNISAENLIAGYTSIVVPDGTTIIRVKSTGTCTNQLDVTINAVNPCPNCVATNVTIGSQIWTSCNLNVTTYRDGTIIPQVTSTASWDSLTTGAWCHYDNNPENDAIYGKLYNWYAIAGIHDNNPSTPNKIIAPVGYHIATDAEFNTLTQYLNVQSPAGNVGGKMKESGFCHWLEPNTDATNTSGFAALPGGYRSPVGQFNNINIRGSWWTSTETSLNSPYVWSYILSNDSGSIIRDISVKPYGLSARLVKDTSPSTTTTTTTVVSTTTTTSSTSSTTTTTTTVAPTTTTTTTVAPTTTTTTTVAFSNVLSLATGYCNDPLIPEYTYYVDQTVQNLALQNGDIAYEDPTFTLPVNGYGAIAFIALFNSVKYQFYISTIGEIFDVTVCSVEPTITTPTTTTTTTTVESCPDCIANDVTINSQIWTGCNLDVATYANGDEIPQVTDPTAWAELTTGAWCYYNNDPANGTTYGKLYNWYAVNDSRGLAPTGYHVPLDEEWDTLIANLGTYAGGKMKETGFCHWLEPNTGATNTSGFTALPGGLRNSSGSFNNIGNRGFWWTSSDPGLNSPYVATYFLSNDNQSIIKDINNRWNGFSVRLIKDASPTTTTTTTVAVYAGGFSVGTENNVLGCAETVSASTLYSNSPTFDFGSFVYTNPELTIIFVGGNLYYKNILENNLIRVTDSGQIDSTVSC